MPKSIYPWPLSEVSALEAESILALPPRLREGRLNRLKNEIKNGELERRERMMRMSSPPNAP